LNCAQHGVAINAATIADPKIPRMVQALLELMTPPSQLEKLISTYHLDVDD
jgi:hypothetical protein